MKLLNFFFLSLIFCFPGCNSKHESIPNLETVQTADVTNLKNRPQELVYNLNESSTIIMKLLKNDSFSEILAEDVLNSPDTIDTLIKNFSPVEMAFEAEVLNFKDPVVVLYYDETDSESQAIENSFKEVAYKLQDKAKFVMIEVSKLFKLAEQAGISSAPTIIVIHNRAEIGRVESPNPALLDIEVMNIFSKIS